MKFVKMHGLGNDYVYADCLEKSVSDPSGTAVLISDRHFGIGSDGLVLILPSTSADYRMRMFNPDGTEAEMCGNAIRCVGKYLFDNGITESKNISIETMAGVKHLELYTECGKVKMVKVDMGVPVLDPSAIPVIAASRDFIARPLTIKGRKFYITCVSMGNPHAVIYVRSTDDFPVGEYGPIIEKHKLFPNKTNVEFVQIISRTELKMRVWERGTGETMACGTGACAALVASVQNGYSEREAKVRLAGGTLEINWRESDGRVFMTGPAVEVFRGEIELPGDL